jgi:hypothetical protein
MTRVLLALAVSAAALMSSTSMGSAEEIRLRMRGGNFDLIGRLDGYDGKFFVVTIAGVGRMALRADRYDCIDGLCPNRVPQPRAVVARAADGVRTSR